MSGLIAHDAPAFKAAPSSSGTRSQTSTSAWIIEAFLEAESDDEQDEHESDGIDATVVPARMRPRVFIAGPEGPHGHGRLRVFSDSREAARYAGRVGGWWLGREVLANAEPENTETAR